MCLGYSGLIANGGGVFLQRASTYWALLSITGTSFTPTVTIFPALQVGLRIPHRHIMGDNLPSS